MKQRKNGAGQRGPNALLRVSFTLVFTPSCEDLLPSCVSRQRISSARLPQVLCGSFCRASLLVLPPIVELAGWY